MGLFSRLGGGSVSTQDQKQITGEEKDDEIIGKFEEWYKESQSLYNKRIEYTQLNKAYYHGELFPSKKKGDAALQFRSEWKSNTKHNKIFENVETIIPIMTSDLPEPMGTVNTNDPDVLSAVRTTEGALRYLHRIDNFEVKKEQIARDMIINRDAVVCPMWDKTKGKHGEVTVEVIDPRYFRVDPNSTFDQQGDYFFKVVPRTYRWAVAQYPDAKEVLKNSFGTAHGDVSGFNDEEIKDLDNAIFIKEVWYWREEKPGKHCVYFAAYINDTLLLNKRSPFWDYDGIPDPELEQQKEAMLRELEESTVVSEGRQPTKEEIELVNEEFEQHRKYRNFMEKEELPYVIIPSFPDYTSPFSSTSLIEQVMSLQDSLDKRKQQIDENANLTGNGQWINEKDSGVSYRQLSSAPNLVIEPNPGSRVEKVPGIPLPPYIMQDKDDTAVAIDNIMGANSISKGQQVGAKSATEATILKNSDEGRLSLQMRHLATGLEKIYKWQLQIMKLMYRQERQVILFDSVGNIESHDKIMRDNIPDGMQIFIDSKAAQPNDQFTKRREADALFNSGSIGPLTYFKMRGDIPDIQGAAEELDKWRRGELFAEPPAPPSIEEQAHQENEAIRSGQVRTINDIPANPEATEAHVLIHRELFNDPKSGMSDSALALLEEHMGLESEILDNKLTEKVNATSLVEPAMQQPVEQGADPMMQDPMMAMEGEAPQMSDEEMAAMIEAEAAQQGGIAPPPEMMG